MINVLLVDDHDLFRDSLKTLLEQDGEICVVACARDGREAFELCELHMPDIVLMDILMPVYGGVEGVRLIKDKHKKIKVIMLTSLNDGQNVFCALNNGADGYLSKNLRGEELVSSIKSISDSTVIIQKDTLNSIVRHIDSKSLNSEEENTKVIELSEKEKDLIRMLVDGMSNKEIAAYYKLSEGSIKNSLTRILRKLNLEGRVQLVVYAVRNGLI